VFIAMNRFRVAKGSEAFEQVWLFARGPRDASHFEKVYVVTTNVKGPVVLLDDVCTTGGHLVGAYRRLNDDRNSTVQWFYPAHSADQPRNKQPTQLVSG
jgi:hypothetical protein